MWNEQKQTRYVAERVCSCSGKRLVFFNGHGHQGVRDFGEKAA